MFMLPSSAHDPADEETVLEMTRRTAPGGGPCPVPLLVGPALRRTIGRYLVLEPIGRGAMGEVWLGYDPSLARQVAIKVLRTCSARDEGAAPTRQRFHELQKEAQAAAQLMHPNVTAVYETGIDDGVPFLAMEYVSGTTLRRWAKDLEAGPDRWRRVVEVMIAAGRGIAAAHAHGVLHRDFKPDNVLVGQNGAVKVADFGLADFHVESSPLQSVDVTSSDPSSALDANARIEIRGTPAYMPPEQYRGREGDERSDIYAFCVTFYELLYGHRPHAGSDLRSLYLSKLRAPMLPESNEVPDRIGAAVIRGLEPDPAHRWQRMELLVAALEHDPTQTTLERRNRRLTMIGAVGILSLVGSMAWHGVLSNAKADTSACEREGLVMDRAWGSDRRAAVRDALRVADPDGAASMMRYVDARVTRFSTAWQAQRSELCEATGAGVASRRSCLQEAALDLDAATLAIAQGGAQIFTTAPEVLRGLPDLERCKDVVRLGEAQAARHDAGARPQWSARWRLVRASRLRRSGAAEASRELLERVNGDASGPSVPDLDASLALEWSRHAIDEGEYERALEHAERAVAEATRARRWDLMAEANAAVLELLAGPLTRMEEARRVAPSVRGLLERETGAHREVLLAALATLATKSADHASAVRMREEVLALASRNASDDPVRLADAWRSLGEARLNAGDYVGAREALRRGLTLRGRALGPSHPSLATDYDDLGVLEDRRGNHVEALQAIRRGLALREAALPSDHPDVATSLLDLGNALHKRGRHRESLAAHRRALKIVEARLGARHIRAASLHNSLGLTLRRMGDFDGALEEHQIARSIWASRMGDEHPWVAASRNNLALIHLEAGDPVAAERELRAALSVLELKLGPDHTHLGLTLDNLGEALLQQGNAEAAVVARQRALQIYEDAMGHDAPQVLEVLDGLARSRAAAGDTAGRHGLDVRRWICSTPLRLRTPGRSPTPSSPSPERSHESAVVARRRAPCCPRPSSASRSSGTPWTRSRSFIASVSPAAWHLDGTDSWGVVFSSHRQPRLHCLGMGRKTIRLVWLALALPACVENVDGRPPTGGDDFGDAIGDGCSACEGEDDSEWGDGAESGGSCATGPHRRPFGHHGFSYAPDVTLPNLASQADLDATVEHAYDRWKIDYVRPGCEPGRFFVDAGVGDSTTLSEAHGFGMLLTVYMAGHDSEAREVFDGLVRYYLDHPSEGHEALMAWSQEHACGDDQARGSKTDGDLDIAYALLLADVQWGSEETLDYRALADQLIAAIGAAETDFHGGFVHMGDWTTQSFRYADAMRSSDFMPAHFEAFEQRVGDGRWSELVDDGYAILGEVQARYAADSGLLPDFIVNPHDPQPAEPGFLEGPYDGGFYYNACRVPLRVGVHRLTHGDARAGQLLAPVNAWIRYDSGGDPLDVSAGFDMDGAPLPGSDYSSMAFVGPVGVAAMTSGADQVWVNDLWRVVADRANDEGYYEDTLAVLSMIAMSGNWWAPDVHGCP